MTDIPLTRVCDVDLEWFKKLEDYLEPYERYVDFDTEDSNYTLKTFGGHTIIFRLKP